MIAGSIVASSLVILGLSGAIAVEVVNWKTRPAASFAGPAHQQNARIPSRAAMAHNDVDGSLREILARPIFSPDRRPTGRNTKSVAGLARLTGIVVAGSRKIAIFAGSSGEHPVIAEVGSRLNAYEISEISDSGVTVIGPAGTMVMTPVFDAAQSAIPKPTMPALPKPPGKPRP
jgi:hypothetical protein